MKDRKITIENEMVYIPSGTKMSIAEIANLFGIYYQTTKRFIRDIEKSGVASGDYSGSSTCEGSKVYPDYYGLEMVIAVAFRVQSANAEIFRRWIYKRVIQSEVSRISEMLIQSVQNPSLN